MANVGVGIVTCRRPEFFAECVASVKRHLGWVSVLAAWHDGPDPTDHGYLPDGGYTLPLFSSERNEGVAACKNHLLRLLLAEEVTWCVLIEDDIAVDSPLAVLGYIEACRESGFEHLNFHGHGHWRPPVGTDPSGAVEFYDNYSGGFSVTSRHAIEVAGLLNEQFFNSWEHVEWTLRLAQFGFTTKWRQAADAIGSESWLHEIPGGHDASIIAADPETGRHAEEGRAYWKRAYPDTWPSELG